MFVSNGKEFHFYLFGLRLGFASLFANGFALGVKKTIGKISQPINSYSRFPEFNFMDSAIDHYTGERSRNDTLRILDVGSPKCFGFYLARKLAAQIHSTDISILNVAEYMVMWNAVKRYAKGEVSFSLHDARNLGYPDHFFDIAYSMSVIEHVEGERGDLKSITEMIRVLKPGGLLLVSVPAGEVFVEQQRVGLAGAARRTKDKKAYFFQRIYDLSSLRGVFPAYNTDLREVTLGVVQRRCHSLIRAWGALGENLRGALGFLNPIISMLCNRPREGTMGPGHTTYGKTYAEGDVYGDWLISARRASLPTQRAKQ